MKAVLQVVLALALVAAGPRLISQIRSGGLQGTPVSASMPESASLALLGTALLGIARAARQSPGTAVARSRGAAGFRLDTARVP